MSSPETREKCKVVAVRSDGTEAVLGRDLPKRHAQAIQEALRGLRAFSEIRIESAKNTQRE